MTELTPGKRYRVSFTGVARHNNAIRDGNGNLLLTSTEARNFPDVSFELLPDPLPTTPGSVILDHELNAYQCGRSGFWNLAGAAGERSTEEMLNSDRGPFTVLFDAGADLA